MCEAIPGPDVEVVWISDSEDSLEQEQAQGQVEGKDYLILYVWTRW